MPARDLESQSTQDDIVYGHIFDAILEQRLAPGTKLNEESLAEIFSVSRTIIRRALSRLNYEQVVVQRPNRGSTVANPSTEQARQIVLARRVIEKAVIELVVEKATAKQIEQLRNLVSRERQSFDRGDRGTGIRLSGEFHLLLAKIAGNPPLLSFQRSLVSQGSLIIAQYESRARAHCSYDEHFALIDAIAAGELERAVELMMHHLDHIEDKLSLEEESETKDLKTIFSHVTKK
ncbi:MAG: GntR family transcriptional regulator [Pseudomonadales bacterium]